MINHFMHFVDVVFFGEFNIGFLLVFVIAKNMCVQSIANNTTSKSQTLTEQGLFHCPV